MLDNFSDLDRIFIGLLANQASHTLSTTLFGTFFANTAKTKETKMFISKLGIKVISKYSQNKLHKLLQMVKNSLVYFCPCRG